MRRILRKVACNEEESIGDTSTLNDPGVVDELIKIDEIRLEVVTNTFLFPITISSGFGTRWTTDLFHFSRLNCFDFFLFNLFIHDNNVTNIFFFPYLID